MTSLTALYYELYAFFNSKFGFCVILYSAAIFFAVTLVALMWLCFIWRSGFYKSCTSTTDFVDPVKVQPQEALIEGRELDYESDESPASYFEEDDNLFRDMVKFEITTQSSPKTLCKICLEEKDEWKMFNNDKCSHSFCYDCTISHMISKIQCKALSISCPAPKCRAILNTDICRRFIPADIQVQWDELLCMSLIPETHKLFCPYLDCSALLLNDSGNIFEEIKCLVCNRHFCGKCRVPWHSEFTCKEFKKHYDKKKGKGDKIVKLLAKKKKWQMCPRCKFYVEKSTGCNHISCRCGYEFCYRCAEKWSVCRGKCPSKSKDVTSSFVPSQCCKRLYRAVCMYRPDFIRSVCAKLLET